MKKMIKETLSQNLRCIQTKHILPLPELKNKKKDLIKEIILKYN